MQTVAQPLIQEEVHNPMLEFRHFTIKDGLSKNNISSLYQDVYGYLWIGTSDGLNRYDGKSFRKYFHDPADSTGIISNTIMCFAEDSRNNLWIGTDKGLMKYIRAKDQFEAFLENRMDSIFPGTYVRGIFFDNDSIMYFGLTEGYFARYNFNTGRATWHRHFEDDQPYYFYYTIYEDSQNDLYVGGRGTGLYRYIKDSDSMIRIKTREYDSSSRKREYDASCYLEDSHGNFWVSGLDGIYLYDRKQDEFTPFYSTSTWDIEEDEDGLLWFATGHGIRMYDPRSARMVKHWYNPDNPVSISNNNVRKVLIDHQGNLWFATLDGLNLLIRPEYHFEVFRHVINLESTLSSNKVTKILEDSRGRIWIGTQGEGLNVFDEEKEIFKTYKHDPANGSSIASNNISALFEDSRGDIWVGLWSGIGFDKYDPQTDGFLHYTYNENSLSQDWYNDFAEDEYGNFYLGFWGGPGLTLFDREKEQFAEELRDYFAAPYESRLINDMLIDSKGNLWIASSSNGVSIFEPFTRNTTTFLPEYSNENSIPVVNINCLFEDQQGNIWIGSKGLSRYNWNTGDFTNYSVQDGLSNDNVNSILEDDDGRLWIGTEYGLSRFDPQKEVFKSFYEYDGIAGNWFGTGACRLQNGKMIFGGNKGITVFHPDSIVDKMTLPPLYFKQLKIFDKDSLYDLSEIDRIDLGYDQNFISFELGAIDFINPQRLEIQYKLQGFDKDWNDLDQNSREVRFTNIPPGEYVLMLRVSKADFPHYRSKSMFINLEPPFWQKWWFYIIEVIVVLAVLYVLFKLRIRQLLAKKHTAELKQKLLRSQMNPHFIFNSLTAIQNFIYEKKPAEAGKYLSDFARLMRQILDNSREEYISLENEINYLSLYMELQKVRFENKFTYDIKTDTELEAEFTAIPPMLAQPFIENALEHGIKNSGTRGEINIKFEKQNGGLVFEVTDNGIGIDRSTKVSTDAKHKSLAIEISRERLENINRGEKNKIRLSIEDIASLEPGKTGTRVRFSIPLRDF
ncbi:MAG: histidine kinase [Bacteroidales bacterium]|nr:histidine kinase [Bacteroidales bacterium]